MGNFFEDIISAPANAVTGALGLGSMQDTIGLLTGKTGMNMSSDMFNTSLQWEKEKFNKEIELANSAHQREIEDLKDAGISPILGIGGNGANVPSVGGVSPMNMNNAGQGLRDTIFSSIASALDIERQAQENELLKAQVNNINTQTGYTLFRQNIEEALESEYDFGDGLKANRTQLGLAMLMNELEIQEIAKRQANLDYGYDVKYGGWKRLLENIRLGTGSVKDIAGAITDIIKEAKGGPGPLEIDANTINTKLDKKGNEYVTGKTYSTKSYRRR